MINLCFIRFATMKYFFTVLFIVPFLSFCQTINGWQLFYGTKKLSSGISGHIKNVEIPGTNNKIIKVKYFPSSTKKSWVNSLIIMDSNRVVIERKILENKNNSIIISNKSLFEFKKVIVYVRSKPSDPKLAAKVRIGIIPLVAIKLQEQ
jgi:hypothetical protein